MPRIAILGGGLCGRLTALQLAEQGLSVALFDKGGRKGEHAAAYVAAAMLTPATEAVDGTPEVVRMGWQGIPLWRNIIGRLPPPRDDAGKRQPDCLARPGQTFVGRIRPAS